MIFSFLESFKKLLQDCLSTLDNDSVRDNAIMIYELMDEVIDNGYPQITEYKLIKKYIQTTANIKKSK